DGVGRSVADRLEFRRKLALARAESGCGERVEDNRANPSVEGGVGKVEIGLDDLPRHFQRTANRAPRMDFKNRYGVEPDHAPERRMRREWLGRGCRDEVTDLARKAEILIENRLAHRGRGGGRYHLGGIHKTGDNTERKRAKRLGATARI